MFWRPKEKAKMLERNLHFRDLRGTAATKFYIAGLPVRVIAEIIAWEEETVQKIIRRYVRRSSVDDCHTATVKDRKNCWDRMASLRRLNGRGNDSLVFAISASLLASIYSTIAIYG